MATQGTTSATGAHLTFIKTDPETCTPSNVNTFNKVLNTPTKKSEGTPAKAVTEPKPENLIPTSPNTIPPRRIALYNELSAAIKQFNVLSQSDKPIDWKKTTIPNLKPLLEEALTIENFTKDRKLYNLANDFMEGEGMPAIFQAGVSGAEAALKEAKATISMSLEEKAKIVQSAMDNLKSVTGFEKGLLGMKSDLNTFFKNHPDLSTAAKNEQLGNIDKLEKRFAPYFNEAQGLLKQAQVEMKNIQAAQAVEKANALEETKKTDAATLTMAVGYASMLSGTGGKTSLAFANEVLGGVEGGLGKLDEKGNLLVPAKTTLASYTALLGEDFAKTAFGGYKISLEGSLLIKSVVLRIRGNLQQTTTLNSNDKETALKNLDAEIAKMTPAWNRGEAYLAQINSALQPPSKA